VDCEKQSSKPDRLRLEVNKTLSNLVKDEDTDHDKKITIEDKGDKFFTLKTRDGNVLTTESTYHLSNLRQAFASAKNKGLSKADIKIRRIIE